MHDPREVQRLTVAWWLVAKSGHFPPPMEPTAAKPIYDHHWRQTGWLAEKLPSLAQTESELKPWLLLADELLALVLPQEPSEEAIIVALKEMGLIRNGGYTDLSDVEALRGALRAAYRVDGLSRGESSEESKRIALMDRLREKWAADK